MRLREVFRYELGYRLRSPSTWAYAAFLFLVMGWGLVATAEGSAPVHVNAPQQVAQGTMFGGLFGLLVSAALFGQAAIRDVAAGMDPLLYTTRLRKAEYLGGRFLAALAINAIVVLAIPLGFWVATVTPLVEAEALGPNRLATYLQSLLLFLLPNLVLVGAILFTIGSVARRAIPVYLGAAGVFIGYVAVTDDWSRIESPMLSALGDPLGINALMAMSRYWTPSELNTRLIGFPAMLVWNRVLWLTVAVGLLAVLHRRFRFAHADEGGRRRKDSKAVIDTPLEWRGPMDVPQVAGVFALRTRVRQTLDVARQSLAEVMSGRAFQVAWVGAIGLVLLWGWNAADTAFDTPTWPVTHLVVSTVLHDRSVLIPWLVIAVYAGELVWKDREVGAAEIADAVPVPTGIALLGRFLALVAIIVAFHTAFLVGGLLLQTLQGYTNFELGLYVRVLFGLYLAANVLLAALAMTIHVLVNQKYVGQILVLMACLLSIFADRLGLPYLAVYNSGPGWTYSDMNGFGPFLRPYVWFKLYWAAWALLLGVVTVLFWVRGRERGVRRRIARARARFRGPAAWMAGVATASILALGGFVFYNTKVSNDDPAPNEAGRPQAEYERRYGRFEDAPQPVITTADLRLEIYPDEPAVDVRGRYRLVNRAGVAIDSVHVVLNRDVEVRSISLDRPARPVVVDEETGYRIFALGQALAPGESLRLSFELALRPRGFRSRGVQTAVVGNGTYFDRRWLPFIGYQPWFELSDGAARKRFGLGPVPPMPGPEDAEARRHDTSLRNEDRVQVEAIVGTAADQIPVVTGELRRSWTENGRRYVHSGTDTPTSFVPTAFSAKYAVAEDRWHDVALQIFHHPAHRYNVDRMLAGMKGALDYYTKVFGPYPYHRLRVVEVPPYSINGRAMMTAIVFSEQNFITRTDGGRVDHTFFGTAHEIAHSWWGGQVRGAHVRGRDFLSETLSNYSAMMVTEKILGPEQARRVYDFQMDRYLSRRAELERDVPLIEVEEHPPIAYGKGAVAMYTLREQIGEEAVNGALRRFLEKHRNGVPPYPTSLDLLAELRAVTPSSMRYLLTDLFETITLWDVETRRAVVARTGRGQYEVTLDIVAKKVRADSVGRETETPMNDFVDIGVFAPGTGDGLGAPLYLKRHRIRSGKQTIRVTVAREPARAGIDPWHKLIDRQREDNVAGVEFRATAIRVPTDS
ncbi:MAG TPA: M1 family aminopeptidase [Thermoanaerobaculia bacterium]|nr:M1 family aminopeptidase [Thermoanaerobaculia bacterium]